MGRDGGSCGGGIVVEDVVETRRSRVGRRGIQKETVRNEQSAKSEVGASVRVWRVHSMGITKNQSERATDRKAVNTSEWDRHKQPAPIAQHSSERVDPSIDQQASRVAVEAPLL